jgi:hypothetical protein
MGGSIWSKKMCEGTCTHHKLNFRVYKSRACYFIKNLTIML